jgi:uncharacterized protein YciI
VSEQYLYQLLPGARPELASDPSAWTPQDTAIATAHIDYLEQGSAAGTVIMAGRCQDGVGPAIVVIEVEDEAAARRFMENDPFVAGGLFSASLHPYRVAISRKPL